MLDRLLSLILPLSSLLSAAEFKVGKSAFSLDDKAFQIRSGEIHYSRVPRAEWRSRIQMAKSMGLNTISTYVFWNYHETQAGEFDFKGEKDVMEFVRLCGVEDMKVVVRPGPYLPTTCCYGFGRSIGFGRQPQHSLSTHGDDLADP